MKNEPTLISVFAGLIDAQISGNQSFTQTIIGLSRKYEVHIFNVIPDGLDNISYSAFDGLNVYYHKPGFVLSKVISFIKNKRAKKSRVKNSENNINNKKIASDPLSDYSTKQLNILGLIYIISCMYMVLCALVNFKIILKSKFLYGYEISGVYAAVALKYIFFKKNVFRRFQGVSILEDSIWSTRSFFHSVAFYISNSPIIMADDGTKGDVIARKICSNAKLFFMRNGLDFFFLKNLKDEELIISKKPVISSNAIKILALSKLKLWKRVDRCINFCDYYSKKFSVEIHLKIVGDGDQMNNLKRMVDCLDNHLLSVKFDGAIPRNLIPRIILENDFLISFYSVSNAGNPLFEAYAAGLNIITFDDCSLPKDIVQSKGVTLIEPFEISPSVNSDSVVKKAFANYFKRYNDRDILTWERRMELELEFIDNCIKDGLHKPHQSAS